MLCGANYLSVREESKRGDDLPVSLLVLYKSDFLTPEKISSIWIQVLAPSVSEETNSEPNTYHSPNSMVNDPTRRPQCEEIPIS